MSIATQTELTVDDLAAMPDGERFELVDGELVERSTSPESAYLAGEIYARLREYCFAHPFAVALPDGAGFTLRPGELDLLRKPDASVVLKTRLPSNRAIILPQLPGLKPRQTADATWIITHLGFTRFFIYDHHLHIAPAPFGDVNFVTQVA